MTQTRIIHPDISKRTKILMEIFYIAHLWTKLFEVAHNWIKLLQIGKIWFDWWTSSNVSSLSECFCFHLSLNETFLTCPYLIEGVIPNPNAPILLKRF